MSDQRKRKSRSYSWIALDENGMPTAGRDGLEYFRAIRDGAVPQQPIAATIGWQVTEVEQGYVCLSAKSGEHLMHAAGYLHGGVLATLLDSATAGAVMTTIKQGSMCSTVQLSIQYLATVRKGVDELAAEGSVTHRGRRICTAEGVVRDGQNKIYARATATLLVTEK